MTHAPSCSRSPGSWAGPEGMWATRCLGVGRAACLLMLAALLGGCDSYPQGWASVDRSWFATFSRDCPDLSGTYRLHPGASSSLRLLEQSFIGHHASTYHDHWPWETMTISGNAAEQLTLTLARSPEAMAAWRAGLSHFQTRQYEAMMSPERRREAPWRDMSDQEYEDNLKKLFLWPLETVELKRGRDYSCTHGWIQHPQAAPASSRGHAHAAIARNGEVSVARDRKGFLVVHAVYRSKPGFAGWCGDNCFGFHLGSAVAHDWGHWAPTTPAWTGEVPRPWAGQPPPVTKPGMPNPARKSKVQPVRPK